MKKIRDNKGRFVKTTVAPNKRELYNLYWKKEFSLSKLAEVFGVCLEQVRKWMIKYQIQRRPQYFHEDSEETRIKKSNSHKGKSWGNHSEKAIEKMRKPKSKIHIRNLCRAQKKYFKEHPEAIERLREINLGKKCSEKTREKRRKLSKGDKNPNWIDGRSYEPYPPEFKKLRNQIKKRDKYVCQVCGDCIPKFISQRIRLVIHHVDYNKKNNNPLNLITLCNFCHSSVNSSREQWTEFFKEKIPNFK